MRIRKSNEAAERWITNKIDRRETGRGETDELITSVYPKILEMLRQEGYKRISPDDFAEYDKDQIEKNKDTVRRKKVGFTTEQKTSEMRGEILEAIVLEQIEQNWFTDISTLRASEYDDYMHGVDVIFTKESGLETETAALTLDATTSAEGLRNKFEKSKTHKAITEIKYFTNRDGTIHAALKGVPYLITYTDPALFRELVLLWDKKNKKVEGVQNLLAMHKVQCIFLKQMLLQIDHSIFHYEKIYTPKTLQTFRYYKGLLQDLYTKKMSELGLKNRDIINEQSVIKVLECIVGESKAKDLIEKINLRRE